MYVVVATRIPILHLQFLYPIEHYKSTQINNNDNTMNIIVMGFVCSIIV